MIHNNSSLDFFKNKRVVVTGGSAGLGLELVKQLSELGAKVFTFSRREQPHEIKRDNIFYVQADISNKNDIYPITASLFQSLGGIDIVINSASYLGSSPLRSLLNTECEDLEDVLATNLVGLFRLTKTLLPAMLSQGGGVIVNISSDAAVSAYPKWGAYSASKAALDHLTKIWTEELAGEGVQFYAVDPGDMYTAMHLAAIPDASKEGLKDPALAAVQLLKFISKNSASGRVKL